jgi:tRNA A-37 threonylcarbamoyl transferase component Bud32
MGNLLPQEFKDYKNILSAYHISFIEDDYWLHVNIPEEKKKLFVFLSFKSIYVLSIIHQVLPILIRHKLPFKMVKNEQILLKLNNGGFGNDLIGKNMLIYFNDSAEANFIAKEISSATNIFQGPLVSDSIRTGEIIYVPPEIKFEFNIPKIYRRKVKKIIGKYFLPYQIIHKSHKTEIWKGVNLKGLRFTSCIIKKAMAFRSEDQDGRDMYDRILWEKKLLTELKEIIPVPAVVDFFEINQDHYLVMEYFPGITLESRIRSLFIYNSWKGLGPNLKSEILKYFLNVIEIIEKLHDEGFVHRDITSGNFVIGKDKSLSILDFELAYSIKEKKPNPAYILGSHGYMSPEQLEVTVPTEKEDIFSLGALLLFMVTGIHPKEFIDEDAHADLVKIESAVKFQRLENIISNCLKNVPNERPALSNIRDQVLKLVELKKDFEVSGQTKEVFYEEEYFA